MTDPTPNREAIALVRGPYPDASPWGAIGRSGSPDAYLIDPGAGSGGDRVTRFWPDRATLNDIHRRGGEIMPLFALTRNSTDQGKPEGVAIPAGYALVPVNPTDAMWVAGDIAQRNALAGETYLDVWPAMLAAAPTPSTTHTGEGEARLREALEQLVSFVSVMVGSGASCRIPETVRTPLGIDLKIGEIMRNAQYALRAGHLPANGDLAAVDDGLGNDWFGDNDRARQALSTPDTGGEAA